MLSLLLALQGCRVSDLPLEDRTNYQIGALITAGDLKLRQGDYAEAERAYLDAWAKASPLQTSKSVRLGLVYSHLTLFDPLDRLGTLYLQTRNYQKAESYFQESLTLRDKQLNKSSIFRVPPRLGLGLLYSELGEESKSAQYFTRASKLINRATTSYVSIDSYRKTILFQQVEDYLGNRELRKALRALNQLSSAISGSAFMDASNFNQDQAAYFELKGRYHLLKGEMKEAKQHFDKAKKIATAYVVAPALFKTLRSLALLEWKQNNVATAANLFAELIMAYRQHVRKNFVAMTEYERENFYQSLKEDFELFNSFVVSNPSHPESSTWNGLLYDQQLFSKALLLNEINKRKLLILSSNNESLQLKLHEWQAAKDELANAYFAKNPDRKSIAFLEAKIENLERDINQATGLINVMDTNPTWRDVQAKLHVKEAALEVIRIRHFDIGQSLAFTDSVFYLFLSIDPDSSHPTSLLLKNGNELESRALPFYRNSLFSQQDEHLSYASFWLPLLPLCQNKDRIYFSSDGVYNQISLNTLRNSDGRYVVDEVELILVTNTRDLLRTITPVTHHTANLFGRPDYLLDDSRSYSLNTKITTRSMSFDLMDDIRENEFADLPKTENEINDISQILGTAGWEVNRFLGEEATEHQVKVQESPGILHIATHGFFRVARGSHALLQSGLIMAGVNNSAQSSEDGVLTAYEATNLKLDNTLLVVLSACETGLGEVKNGEGVYGLQRGFLVAGSRYILMSLWKVEDEATSELMTRFYRYWLDGTDIHEAFRKAQDNLRQKYTHPYYWGGFILLGI